LSSSFSGGYFPEPLGTNPRGFFLRAQLGVK
jgi:hypothetical protein